MYPFKTIDECLSVFNSITYSECGAIEFIKFGYCIMKKDSISYIKRDHRGLDRYTIGYSENDVKYTIDGVIPKNEYDFLKQVLIGGGNEQDR